MLGKHLQRNPGDADFIKKFSLATWTVDADAAINVILMILKLEWLSLCIGINFEPEQLKHLFHEPIPNLRYLSLRFRPYGLKASGHHFLFDSAPAIIATWPSAEFPATERPNSVVRATPNFHLNHLSVLASSPLLARTQTLRLRIPGREPVSIIILQPPTLVLDRCSLCGARDWAVFSYHCLLAGDALLIEYDENRHLVAAPGVGESRPREVRVLLRALALRTRSVSVPAHVDMDVCAARQLHAREGVLTFRFPWHGDVGHVLRELGLPRMVVVDDDDDVCAVERAQGQRGSYCGVPRRTECEGLKASNMRRVAVIQSDGTFGKILCRSNSEKRTLGQRLT
ncbi:hypothetical protein EDB89DRAFT_955077 [Lactarius sanguifluus]|nr:hypothetical protein EDB89DRAFT_955077 [Lactarius sanguifluus]